MLGRGASEASARVLGLALDYGAGGGKGLYGEGGDLEDGVEEVGGGVDDEGGVVKESGLINADVIGGDVALGDRVGNEEG